VKALVHSLGGLVNSMRRYGEEGERHRGGVSMGGASRTSQSTSDGSRIQQAAGAGAPRVGKLARFW
jgi:hypothetical protein